MKNNVMVVQTGENVKPLSKDITLPNGIRVEHLTRSIVLTNGNRVKLKEGDMLSLNREFIQRNTATEPEVAPATSVATLSASAGPAVASLETTLVPSSPTAPAPVSDPAAAPAFSYRPTAPVGGKLKGVVELGASGFNLFIVRVDNQRNWKLEKIRVWQ